VKLALPWHRGYMFHGPPGTGKTSMVKALANEFKLDLWYVSLGDLKEEASLINLLSEVSPRSILLLEDVDTIQLTHDRDEEPKAKSPTNISLSSLLNALDGVATPHGLVTVMTTNHFDRLDPALTRAGRMDRVEELAYPGTREVDALYQRFYGSPLPSWSHGEAVVPMSQAEVSEVFKRHLDDPEGAARALHAALGEREW
jgi:chaperone BCS1